MNFILRSLFVNWVVTCFIILYFFSPITLVLLFLHLPVWSYTMLIVSPLGSVFLVILFLISSTIIAFTTFYIVEENTYYYFTTILLLFIISIILLVVCDSVLLLFVAWDGLGVSSFMLVLYYSHWDSVNSAIITVITNRIGDYCLFWFVAGLVSSGLSLGCSMYFLLPSILIVVAFTNSAQYPFSSWLPKAIAAPTPISALVHSSTLVTAGIFLLLKYYPLWLVSNLNYLLLYVGFITIIISSLSALLEIDIKNVVALSTLSQIGFLIVSLGLNLPLFTIVHLISHALFNSCLFLQVGFIMHSIYSGQDTRSYLNIGTTSVLSILQIMLCLLCLCGFTFTSGFLSKELILEAPISWNLQYTFCLLLLLCVFATFIYSLRLFNALLCLSNTPLLVSINSVVFISISFTLCVLSLIFLSWVNINIAFYPNSQLCLENSLPFLFVFSIVVVALYTMNHSTSFSYFIFFNLFHADYISNLIQNGVITLSFFELSVVNLGSMFTATIHLISTLSNNYFLFYNINMAVFSCCVLLILLVLYFPSLNSTLVWSTSG